MAIGVNTNAENFFTLLDLHFCIWRADVDVDAASCSLTLLHGRATSFVQVPASSDDIKGVLIDLNEVSTGGRDEPSLAPRNTRNGLEMLTFPSKPVCLVDQLCAYQGTELRRVDDPAEDVGRQHRGLSTLRKRE